MGEEERKKDATYLGDGVYATRGSLGIELTTHDGVQETNCIVLEFETWVALRQFVEKAWGVDV
jgi:hypothetical protein